MCKSIVQIEHLIEDESEWLTFEPGDLLGWRWNSGGSRVRWDSSGESIINMKYAGHDDTAFNSGSSETRSRWRVTWTEPTRFKPLSRHSVSFSFSLIFLSFFSYLRKWYIIYLQNKHSINMAFLSECDDGDDGGDDDVRKWWCQMMMMMMMH